MSFSPAEIVAPCQAFGPQVGPLPDEIDGAQLTGAPRQPTMIHGASNLFAEVKRLKSRD
jgi:hypothetical protein